MRDRGPSARILRRNQRLHVAPKRRSDAVGLERGHRVGGVVDDLPLDGGRQRGRRHARPEAQPILARATGKRPPGIGDRKSTRLNSSHTVISYAVFCLKKKKNTTKNRNSKLSSHNNDRST